MTRESLNILAIQGNLMSDLDICLPLTEEMLASMPMVEVFKLVRQINEHCDEITKQLNIYSENMKIIHSFINNGLASKQQIIN